eukprot:501402_1
MANAPSCYGYVPASIWIEYIFKRNAPALSVLIILYVFALLAYILYTLQIDALSPFNNSIDHLTHSFQRSSFYRQYYIPYIHYYGCKFLLFIILLPMSLLYFDSLFRYRNDCNSITNAWIIFSIIFMLQFWYLSIKFIIYNPEFIAIKYDPRRTSTFGGTDWNEMDNNTTNINMSHNQFQQNNIQQQQQYTQPNYTHKPRQVSTPNFNVQYVQPSPSPEPFPNNNINHNEMNQPPVAFENVVGEHDNYNNPSVPSMNAPKPMQNNEYVEYYDEQDTGAVANYNPFDSDYNDQENDENDNAPIIIDNSNGSYVVVDEESDNIPIPHYKISIIDETVQSNTHTHELDHFLTECGCLKYKDALIQNGLNHITDLKYKTDDEIKFILAKASLGGVFQINFLKLVQDYKNDIFIPGQEYIQQNEAPVPPPPPPPYEPAPALPQQIISLDTPRETHLPPPQPRSPTTSIIKQESNEITHENMVSEYENEMRFSESKNSQNVEANEYLRVIEMGQFIKYFKYTTIFFMILCPFIMATTWMFIPYYALNTSSYVYFYVFCTPFIIIYRINMRFMNGDYYNHYNYTNILNDFPFVLFLLKISSI